MCEYIRLSGGGHGFRQMLRGLATDIAFSELGAVISYTTYAPGKPRIFDGSFKYEPLSISYHDKNGDEVAYYSIDMETLQLFDPPRKVDDIFKKDIYL